MLKNRLLKNRLLSQVVVRDVGQMLSENRSLRFQRGALWAVVLGFSALSATSISSCRRASTQRDVARLKALDLAEENALSQKELAKVKAKNKDLEEYKDFVDAIVPFYPEQLDCRTRTEEKEIETKNIEAQRKQEEAFKTIGVDYFDYLHLKAKEI